MSNELYARKANYSDLPPEWHFIRHEAMLVRHLIGDGVTALGRAHNGEKGIGQYYIGFFSLSIGLERLAKLIIITDHAIDCSGALKASDWVKKYGHDLGELLNQVEIISGKRALNLQYTRPNNPIAFSIIENLSSFADAKFGRYANYMGMENPGNDMHEPIGKWWTEVGTKILEEKYIDKNVKSSVENRARTLAKPFEDNTMVTLYDETRQRIPDMLATLMHSEQASIVQTKSRYHSLTIVRWLAEIYRSLSETATHQAGQKGFWQSYEFFLCYIARNTELNSKVWPKS